MLLTTTGSGYLSYRSSVQIRQPLGGRYDLRGLLLTGESLMVRRKKVMCNKVVGPFSRKEGRDEPSRLPAR